MTSFDKLEKIFLWIGASLGILISAITIWSHFTKPEPPNLDVQFALTQNNELRICPSIVSDESEFTDPIPIGLWVKNSGESTAKNVELKIIHPILLQILSQKSKEPKIIYGYAKPRLMTLLDVGDIHPKETIHLDDELFALTENFTKMKIPVEFADKVKANLLVGLVGTFEIEARISAENLNEKNILLYLTLGPVKDLAESGERFFEVKNGHIVDYKPKEVSPNE